MPLCVTRNGAAMAIINNQAVFESLEPGHDILDLLFALKRHEEVFVTFKDGTTGTIAPLDGMVEPSSAQTALALIPPAAPPHDYQLECKLIVPLEVTVCCSARTCEEAAETARSVFNGAEPPPGFSIEADRERVAEIFCQIDEAMHKGSVPHLLEHVRGLVISSSEPIDEYGDVICP